MDTLDPGFNKKEGSLEISSRGDHDGVLPYLPRPNQIRPDWLVGPADLLPVCHVVVSIGSVLRVKGSLCAWCMGGFWQFWQSWQDNRTAPGDPFTLEKARAPTSQTRVLWGRVWVRTVPT